MQMIRWVVPKEKLLFRPNSMQLQALDRRTGVEQANEAAFDVRQQVDTQMAAFLGWLSKVTGVSNVK
jgi:hypothetical protein